MHSCESERRIPILTRSSKWRMAGAVRQWRGRRASAAQLVAAYGSVPGKDPCGTVLNSAPSWTENWGAIRAEGLPFSRVTAWDADRARGCDIPQPGQLGISIMIARLLRRPFTRRGTC